MSQETSCRDILNKQNAFNKNGVHESKTCPVWEMVTLWEGAYKERVKEAECSGNIVY
jgi:hypothetical protein